MKKLNLIKRLWTDSHEKQSPQRFARYAAMLIMLLTLGVGQMWADPWVKNDVSTGLQGTKTVGDKLNGGSEWWYNYQTNGGWNSATDIQVLIGTSSSSYSTVNASWYADDGSNKKVHADIGSFTFDKSGKWYAVGKYKSGTTAYTSGTSWTGNTSLSTSMSTSNSPYWTVNPPAVSSFAVSTTGSNILSGTGTSADPYIIAYNGSLVLALSGSKAKTDANSSLQYNTSGTWNTTTSRTISSITSSERTSVTVKMRCYNSTASLSGTESTKTIYYKAEASYNVTAAKTPSAGGSVTPTSATKMGTTSGGDITASPNTGYTFTSWAITSGSGYFGTTGTATTSTTANTKFRPSATATVTATFTPKTYSITLDGNEGSDGSATATYNSSTLTSFTGSSRASYDLKGYYTATSGGTKVINADGTLVASAGSYTNSSSQWIYDNNVELHAQWTYNPVTYSVTYAVGTGYTSYGSLSAKNTSTSAAIASGSSLESGTGVTFTATPNTGYVVEGWYTDAACTAGKHDEGINTYSTTLSGNITVYVKFVEKTWSVAFAAETGGSVTTPASTPKTVGQVTGISIAATPATGYTFNTWTITSGSGSFTSAATTNSNTFKPTAETTVTASFTETMSALTTSCHYDVGNPGYAVPTKSASSIGIATTSTITATAAGTGYTFAGWTLTNCTRTDGGAPTATSITIRSNGDGAAASVVANYRANTYSVQFDPNNAQYAGAAATGTMSNQDFTYGVSQALSANGFSREGYTFAGWATTPAGAKEYDDGESVSNLTSTNGATVTLYAKWTGKSYTVSLNDLEGTCATKSMEVTMGSTYGAGTPALPEAAAVTPPAGYIFDGWYTAAGGGTKVTGTTQVTTAVDHTLYARYIQKAQVYFKNTLGWSKVYVTYDAYWDSSNPSKGSGNSGKTTHLMTLVAGTKDVYYDDIPDAILSNWKGSIVFYNEQQNNYANFRKGQAVFRRDFDSDATMFVPVPNDPNKFTLNAGYGEAGTTYYSTDQVVDKSGDDVTNYRYKNGYWVRYNNVEAGYSLKGSWDSWGTDHYIVKETASGTTYTYTIRGLSANTTYYFKLFKHCATSNTYSSQFSNTGTMTSGNCSNWTFNAASTTNNAGIKTTVAGDYTFNFTFGDGEVKLSVDYPFYANDYKVIYSYTKDGAKTYESEIIKCRANGLDTISVFIHSSSDASNRSLKIAKCTGINASGVPSWNNSYATIDISSVSESGVYNFIITQDGSAAASGAYWNKYTGNYYIRTAASDGGWDMYKYRQDNIMTLSEYSLTQTLSEPYSHYYCRFIGSTSVDITYAVATDYSPNISGTMTGDATIGVGSTTLPATANVRFSWNEKTNAMRRAYLKNAQGAGNNRYLVLHGADDKIRNNDDAGTTIPASGDLHANELLFTDIGNWVYQVELKAIPGAKVSLIANYNNADRYLVGDGSTKWETIIGGAGTSLYSIKAIYDFKTNRLMTAWIPGGDITEDISDVDVLLLRYAQDAGTAITFDGAYTVGAKEVIGAIEMRYNDLVGHVANWTSSSRPLLKFFVSFPFDVNVSDIFGLNSAYGDAYIVEEYDGAGRAEKGFFGGDGTTTFWREMEPGEVMKANVGYCVILDNDYFNGDIGNIWDNKSEGSSVYLYFPSASSVGDIQSSSKTINIPEHLCHYDRTFITGGSREVNHINTDSHWNMMGVPIFDTHSDSGISGQPGAVFATSGTDGDGNFNYFYEWSSATNQFSIQSARGYSFKSMHGYMVQYHGDVTFKTAAAPAPFAARKAPQKEQYQIELQVLNSNAEPLNSTFVELRENANDAFELNEDVYMSYNNYAVNIYTLTGNYDVAANVLSINDHTIPVGVKVTKAGTYRFSMPGNFSGEVTLLDTFTGESTNLALDDYEVELPKGTTEDRFFLKTNIKKVATAIDGISEDGSLKDGKAHKFIQNGVMYILQNGVLYDAQGKRVQ